jgi:hypothetical protein
MPTVVKTGRLDADDVVLPRSPHLRAQDACHKVRQDTLINVQLVQERERVIERLEQVLVVFDHLAAHIDAKPLLVHVKLIAIEQVSQRQVTLSDESC